MLGEEIHGTWRSTEPIDRGRAHEGTISNGARRRHASGVARYVPGPRHDAERCLGRQHGWSARYLHQETSPHTRGPPDRGAAGSVNRFSGLWHELHGRPDGERRYGGGNDRRTTRRTTPRNPTSRRRPRTRTTTPPRAKPRPRTRPKCR